MLYKALKPCRFDKFYCVGDIIPGHVIDPGKVKGLIKERGIIAPVPGTEDEEPQEITQEIPQEEIEQASEVDETPQEITQENEETPQEKYNKDDLMDLKKDNLLQIATGMGLPVDDSLTKSQIADAIILAQE